MEGGGGYSEGDVLHPLLIPSVLAVVVKHIRSRDVLAFRLVCKEWNNMILRKKTNIVLLNPKILAKLIPYISSKSLLSARLVCWDWNNSILRSRRWRNTDPMDKTTWGFFFRDYHVGRDDFQRFSAKFGDPGAYTLPFAFTNFTCTRNVSLSNEDTRGFLERYGRFVKGLELHRCNWNLGDLRYVLFESCVNIETLNIVCGVIPGSQVVRGKKVEVCELDCVLHEDPCDFKGVEGLRSVSFEMNVLDGKDQPRVYVEQFFTEFFKSCRNVEVVNFNFSSWYARMWATKFLGELPFKLERLRVLEHVIDPDLGTIQSLRAKAFPLVKLKLRIRYKDLSVEELHGLLSSLGGTLEHLMLFFVEYACAWEFPSSLELKRLRHLELWRFKGQLGFLRDFRGLERLVLGEMELKGQEVFSGRRVFRDVMPGVSVEFKNYWKSRVFS